MRSGPVALRILQLPGTEDQIPFLRVVARILHGNGEWLSWRDGDEERGAIISETVPASKSAAPCVVLASAPKPFPVGNPFEDFLVEDSSVRFALTNPQFLVVFVVSDMLGSFEQELSRWVMGSNASD